MAVRLFVSHSPQDHAHYQRLLAYLKAETTTWEVEFLERQDQHKPESELLDRTDIFIPLVSSNYKAHQKLMVKEVQLAVERAKYRIAMVFPVLLDGAEWRDTVFAQFKVMPTPQTFGETVALLHPSWGPIEEAYRAILRDLREYVSFMKNYTSKEQRQTELRESVQEATRKLMRNAPKIPTRLIADSDLQEQDLYLIPSPRVDTSILFLSANTKLEAGDLEKNTVLQKEYQLLRDTIHANTQFSLVADWTYTHERLIHLFLDRKINLIHFSGAGIKNKAIVLYDHEQDLEIPMSGFNQILKYFSNQLECMVLSACYDPALDQFLEPRVGHIIGLYPQMPAQFRALFLTLFYQKLAEGSSYEEAFNQAYYHLPVRFIAKNQMPVHIQNGKLKGRSYE